MKKQEAHEKMTTTIFAFLPVGSKPTATVHSVRLGMCRTRDSLGRDVVWGHRFHGLNKPRETLFYLTMNGGKREAEDFLDSLKFLLRGPGLINTIDIKHFVTFKQATDLGMLWWRCSLPLADIRAIFYDVQAGFEETIAEQKIGAENRDRRVQAPREQAQPGAVQPGEV